MGAYGILPDPSPNRNHCARPSRIICPDVVESDTGSCGSAHAARSLRGDADEESLAALLERNRRRITAFKMENHHGREMIGHGRTDGKEHDVRESDAL